MKSLKSLPSGFSLPAALSGTVRRKRRDPTRVIVGSFLAVIACGTLLLLLPAANRAGRPPHWMEALFTATSATCVTGLTVFDTYVQFSVFGQLVILLLIQTGGLGLVTLTSFFHIAIGRRLGFQGLRLAGESISLSDAGQSRAVLLFVMKVAFLFESAGAVLLALSFVPRFGAKGIVIAIFLSVSTFCNAGFDILGFIEPGASLAACGNDPYVLGVISVLITGGGLGFLVWQDLAAWRRTHHLRTHTKLVLWCTGGFFLVGLLGILLLEYQNPLTLGPLPWGEKLLHAAFASVSARTAGCSTFPLDKMGDLAKILMTVLMFIGAAPGGTGGGVKVTTVSVILLAIAGVAGGRDEAMIFGRRIGHKTVYRALTILLLSLVACVTVTLVLFYNLDVARNAAAPSGVDCMFEAVSAFATVGLSVGVTAVMNPIARAVTMAAMFLGRVGPVSLAISLSARRDNAAARRAVPPEAHINVG